MLCFDHMGPSSYIPNDGPKTWSKFCSNQQLMECCIHMAVLYIYISSTPLYISLFSVYTWCIHSHIPVSLKFTDSCRQRIL